jgi:8-oxo-dGTP pyrophosphatase MutT (NUDIX family)
MASKQFAALPFRIRDQEISVLLVTTRRKRRWSVPKGWPILPGKPHRTAEIEAYEEAGLIGKAGPKPIGRYRHRKHQGKRKINCDIELFPLHVKGQKKLWPERGQRKVMWLPAQEAAELVRKPQLRRLIARFTRLKKRKLKADRKS